MRIAGPILLPYSTGPYEVYFALDTTTGETTAGITREETVLYECDSLPEVEKLLKELLEQQEV